MPQMCGEWVSSDIDMKGEPSMTWPRSYPGQACERISEPNPFCLAPLMLPRNLSNANSLACS